MGSVACTRLDSWHERQEYFHFQSIIFHFCSNCADSQSICATRAPSPLHLTHIMSWPGHYICALWKFSNEHVSFSSSESPSNSLISATSSTIRLLLLWRMRLGSCIVVCERQTQILPARFMRSAKQLLLSMPVEWETFISTKARI